jgi:very-short-patch-repair endonuclease
MGGQTRHGASVWSLARRQHGVVTRAQLLKLGFTRHAIKHRVATGRLHPFHRGVFAVGRPELDIHGKCMAAVLACGPGAVVSHRTAAELWGIRQPSVGSIELSVPATVQRKLAGVRLHRRRSLGTTERVVHDGIPLTSPVRTLVDLATRLPGEALEAAVNAADKNDHVDPVSLRRALEQMRGQPGVGVLRRLLDRRTFRLTDSELERSFLRLVRDAGLPVPQTGVRVNGFRVDFLWPDLGLVVETDGLRYHRTPAQQARDRRRDQAHTAAGLTTLRFTHAQVRYEPAEVRETLRRVAVRLAGGRVVVRFAGRRTGA